MVGTCATNEATGSHELVGANEQVQSNVIIAKEHLQVNVHKLEKHEQ
jgi:hypothetical protein